MRTVAKHGKCVGRPKNAEVRVHEHLTPGEVEQLAQAAKERWWHGHRDALAIRMVARHAFRVSELCELRRHQIDLRAGLVHVTRKKNGVPSTHPLVGDEVRALRQLRRDWPDGRQVFVTERGAPFTRGGLANIGRARRRGAGFDFPVHFHMLRHACGYYYANRGEDTRSLQLWLGHRSIQLTVRYTEERFKGW